MAGWRGGVHRVCGATVGPIDDELAPHGRRQARHGGGGTSACRGSRPADPQGGRQRRRRRDRDLGGAGRSRARHDRPRLRHVRAHLSRQDRRGEVHQRHRLRAAGGDDRLLQVEGRPARSGAAVDCRAGRGRRRGVRAEEVRHQAARRRPRAGDRDRRAGLPDHRDARRPAGERPRQAREMALDDEDLVQGRQAAADRRHPGEPGAGEDAARDRDAGPGCLLQG